MLADPGTIPDDNAEDDKREEVGAIGGLGTYGPEIASLLVVLFPA